MTGNPLVSIITVVYNGEQFLESTIKSALEQQFDYPFELVIIDGGSKDKTVDIIRQYESKIGYWVSERDAGIFDAMNKGIRAAKGTWLNFMNAGDTFSDQFVLKNLFSEVPTDVAVLYGNNTFRNKIDYAASPDVLAFGYIMACHQSMFFNKALLQGELMYRVEPFKYVCEYEILARIYKLGYGFKFVPMNVCNYADGGVSTTLFWKVRIPRFYWLFKYFGFRGLYHVFAERYKLIDTKKYRYFPETA